MNKLFYSGHDLTHSAGKGPHFTKSWVPILKKKYIGLHGTWPQCTRFYSNLMRMGKRKGWILSTEEGFISGTLSLRLHWTQYFCVYSKLLSIWVSMALLAEILSLHEPVDWAAYKYFNSSVEIGSLGWIRLKTQIRSSIKIHPQGSYGRHYTLFYINVFRITLFRHYSEN